MYSRVPYPSAMRPTSGSVCIVLACADPREADQIGRLLEELNRGYLVTYRRLEDLMCKAPADRVALVILATGDSPTAFGYALKWLRTRWPRCSVSVVADEGSGAYERAARSGRASFLTRPVTTEQWRATLRQAQRAAAGKEDAAPWTTAVPEADE